MHATNVCTRLGQASYKERGALISLTELLGAQMGLHLRVAVCKFYDLLVAH